jgi:hypothetical protein
MNCRKTKLNKMKTKFPFSKWTGGALLAGLTMVGVPAFAQEAQSPDSGDVPAAAPEKTDANASARLPMTASVGFAEQFNTGLQDKSTSFSIARFSVGVAAPVKLNDDFRLDTSLRYGLDAWNWNDAPVRPWHNINTITLASILSYKVDDQWAVYGGGFVRASADNDEALGKGGSGGGLVGFNYKVSDTLSLGAGLAIMSQIKDHTAFVPLITAKWKFADDWMLVAGLSDIATSGYGIEAKWLYNEAWSFGFGAQYHKSRFRIAQANNGVGQEKAAMLYASATWHADPKVDVVGFAGVAVGGMINIYDNAGNELSDTKYDPAPVLGVKGVMRF